MIAHICSEVRGETDRLICEVAQELQASGTSLAGIVKVLRGDGKNGCNHGAQVRVLPDGPKITITQSLGGVSDSCRLDPAAIADAVSAVESGLLDGKQMFILNKFGPEESAGRGFSNVIGSALEQGIPVLVGVGRASREAFDTFAGGLAEALPPDQEVIRNWCISAISQGQEAD